LRGEFNEGDTIVAEVDEAKHDFTFRHAEAKTRRPATK
jgi:hypothetical protein